MKRHKILALVLLVSMSTLLTSCGDSSTTEKKTLLIYSGTAMTQAMEEIAAIIEEQENCTITIQAGNSGSLLETIRNEQVGDLYLPGDDSFIATALREDLVIETALVGYNEPVAMVREGNPLGITAAPASFADEAYVLAIADPEKASVGKETIHIFANMRILDQAMDNVHSTTATAAELVGILKNGEADLIINWYTWSVDPETAPFVDAVRISEQYVSRKKLVLGLLITSEYPELARKFMAYAASDAGQAVFNKYGLYDVE